MQRIARNLLWFVLLGVLLCAPALAAPCDVDDDGDIDRNDINLITAARNLPASAPDDPRDADGNGTITVNDARQCVLQCTLARCEIINPPIQAPAIEVNPSQLDFGEVFLGSRASLSLTAENTGTAALDIGSIVSSSLEFTVFPPTSFTIDVGEAPRTVTIGFSPTSLGPVSGSITFNSNATNEDPVVIDVQGTGIEPVNQVPDISTLSNLEFGDVEEGVSIERILPITNVGDAPLDVNDLSLDNPVFERVRTLADPLPLIIDPGQSRNVIVRMTAPVGSAGTALTGRLTIASNDPDEGLTQVALLGGGLPPEEQQDNPVLGARVQFEDAGGAIVYDLINAETCAGVAGLVEFSADADGMDGFRVVLIDQQGQSVTSGQMLVADGAGSMAFTGIDACGLADGLIAVDVVVTRAATDLPAVPGTPASKNTSSLPPPVLDPLPEVTLSPSIEVCGTSRASTTVRIEGGARVVSTQLDAGTTRFCLDVPLRSNTQNTLLASAIDDLEPPPKPVAYASPVAIIQVNPSEIVFADVFARPLTEAEIADLVERDVINLDDPENYDVFMFTLVLTVGGKEVKIEEPVPVNKRPGSVGYGGGGGRSSGWFGGSGGWSGGRTNPPPPPRSGGCTSGCAQVVIIRPPSGGPVIPGVIIIDGRIKTLKEFFQVTLVIGNTSDSFTLSDMQAAIELPPGLSPVRAGPGTDVSAVNAAGEVDRVTIGEIGPGATGAGQFLIRGDAVGTHGLDVNFQGFITGGGIPDPIPVSGSAGTTVQVFGPPKLGVVVRHPSDPDGPDVVAGEAYPLTVEITNLSSRPALYTSLELFAGGSAILLDENDQPIPGSSEIKDFGIIPPGRTTAATFRMRASTQGEIIACQGISGENIVLTVDIGADSDACNLVNTTPAPFLPLPQDLPPTVIGINPLNGQPNIPLTSSVVAVLAPRSACLVADTWANVTSAPVDPTDPSQGRQIVTVDLVDAGTFYLEELNALGQPVRHIPVQLITDDPTAGGTTIAVLRLGLGDPLSQFFLTPNTRYRVTLVGADRMGDNAVCNAANNVPLAQTFQWTFSTAQVCQGIEPPTVTLLRPEDGSTDRPLNQVIVLDFKNRMNPASIITNPTDPSQNSFSVYQNAMETAGDIEGGTFVQGTGRLDSLLRVLTFTPDTNLAVDSTIHVRLRDTWRDVCGNQLQTPANGVQLFSFQTIAPDLTPPDAPQVNPLPELTNQASIQVSGSAEPNSVVSVVGGTAAVDTTASESGRFSALVPLQIDDINELTVHANDASGNASPTVATDSAGEPLVVINDSQGPEVISVDPPNGATGVARDGGLTVTLSEPLDPATVQDRNVTVLSNGETVSGDLTMTGETTFTFTPDAPLEYSTPYTLRLRANGIQDRAGNGISEELISSFTTEAFPAPVLNGLDPAEGVQNSTLRVTFSGEQLATASDIISDNPGITGTILTSDDNAVEADITLAPLAITGVTTLGLITQGGSADLPFTVLHKTPFIASITPMRALQGTTVDAEMQGSGLSDITSITIDGSGVSVIDPGTGDDSVHGVQLVIDADAAPGVRTITVSTPGGVDNIGFEVLQQPTEAVVDPLPAFTNQINIDVTGQADPQAEVLVQGGAEQRSGSAETDGSFRITVPLKLTETNLFTIIASDQFGNQAPPITLDRDGNPLSVTYDDVLPTVVSATPADGTSGVASNTAIEIAVSEPYDQASVNDAAFILRASDNAEVQGGLILDTETSFRFVPSNPLRLGDTYSVIVQAGGIRDLAGNSLEVSYTSVFSTQVAPPPVTTTLSEDFESGITDWVISNGVWELGPITSDPGFCHGGSKCIGTVWEGNYNPDADSRLISRAVDLPMPASGKEIHLRFWTWFSYSSGDSGRVQLSVWDASTQSWGSWTNVGGSLVNGSTWSLKDIDLTAYAGERVRLGFMHTAVNVCCGSNTDVSSGWYIDDIEIVAKVPTFTGDFETGWADWGATRGIWQIGTPTTGPSCFSGSQCAGTYLNSNYHPDTDSRLVSAAFNLPTAAGLEEVHLRFMTRFSYSSGDSGQVQLSVWDASTQSWGSWTNVGGSLVNGSTWSLKDIDLTAYAGERVRLGFMHTAVNVCCGSNTDVSSGWYIDDIEIVAKVPTFTGDFETGWADWGATRGIWQIGTPTTGPSCFSGSQCAGTYLNSNYHPDTDSRLVSAAFNLPTAAGLEEVHLRFMTRFSYSSGDSGQVQLSVWDASTQSWGSWTNVGGSLVNGSTWSLKDIDLTAYAGERVRLGFMHTAVNVCCGSNTDVSSGWYIDDIEIVAKVPTFTGDFETGWADWGATRGIWQIGTPTTGLSCFSGSQCAGTYLNSNYHPDTDSRLVSAAFNLPTAAGLEEVHLRFMTRFSYSSGDSGQVQLSVWDASTQSWGSWTNVGGSLVNGSTWSLKDIDLTAYAGERVRLGFMHTAVNVCCGSNTDVSSGWYIDDIEIVAKVPTFTGDFETGWADWGATRGIWQIGTPTTGLSCFSGSQCAGTYLNSNYHPDTDSRLVSAAFNLPTAAGLEEVHLRFMTRFSYSSGDSGQVQLSVWDASTQSWGSWTNVGGSLVNGSTWSLKDIDLTAYAGERVRLGFMHTAVNVCCGSNTDVSSGWYIDDIEIVAKVPTFTGDFETGWADWGATRGIWQIGTPTTGLSCFSGSQCAGTYLNSNYHPDTDSRLVSAAFNLPTAAGLEEVHLRFRTWFSYSSGDSGQVQLSVWDASTQSWGSWTNVGGSLVNGSTWSLKDIDLTAYAGERVRLGFMHTAVNVCCGSNTDVSSGWYIDDIEIVINSP